MYQSRGNRGHTEIKICRNVSLTKEVITKVWGGGPGSEPHGLVQEYGIVVNMLPLHGRKEEELLTYRRRESFSEGQTERGSNLWGTLSQSEVNSQDLDRKINPLSSFSFFSLIYCQLPIGQI